MRYHPRIGYTYMPDAKLRVQGSNGGYLVRTNAAGFRSDREFVPDRKSGTFRVMLFGDSQTAGDGTINALRYSDLLEKAVPDLEINNYGLSGTGTDQQLLTYRENSAIEHDLVVIGIYVENVRRLSSRLVRSRDASGEEVFRAKPYFTLDRDGMVLRNVPVPKQPFTEETLPKELIPYVYAFGQEHSSFRNPTSWYATLLRGLTPAGPVREAVKSVLTKFREFQPLPEYDAADNPGWLLLREILATWVRESRTPVLIVLLPHETALMGSSDPKNCQARFSELARDTGCHVFDPLPAFLKLGTEERTALWSEAYGHLSVQGHEALAHLLVPQVREFMSQQESAV
jgi:hypothetical protein